MNGVSEGESRDARNQLAVLDAEEGKNGVEIDAGGHEDVEKAERRQGEGNVENGDDDAVLGHGAFQLGGAREGQWRGGGVGGVGR